MPAFTQFNLAYIQEDPNDKNLLRLQPICSEEGLFSEEDCLALFPDKGYLRVVPDKKEKTTFKNRLRKIMPFCALRLSDTEEATNKIRPNRNYRLPEEDNQQVIYSDAITPLPKDFIYEVITLSVKEKLSIALEHITFVTPKAYIQRGNDWYGPFLTPPKKLARKTERPPSYSLFTFSEKDTQHLFYFPPLEKLILEQKEAFEKESLPIGKPLQILDSSLDFDEQLANLTQPLNLSQGANLLKASKGPATPSVPKEISIPGIGTPLYARAASTSSPQPKSQSLEQIVANQLHFAPKAPTSPKEEGLGFSFAALSKNPRLLAAHLQKLGTLPNFKEAAGAAFPNQPLGKWQTFTVSAFTQQLETLEAERLSLVMQLDKAKDQLAGFIKTTLEEKEDALTANIDELGHTLKTLENEKETLLLAQKQLLDSIAHKAAEEKPLFSPCAFPALQQLPGATSSLSHILHHVEGFMQNAGYDIDKNQILSLLFLLTTQRKITIVHPNKGFAYGFFQDFLKSLSLQDVQLLRHCALPMPPSLPLSEGTPYFVLYNEWIEEPLPNYSIAVLFSQTPTETMSAPSFQLSPWPIFLLDVSVDFSKHLHGQPFSSLAPPSYSAMKNWFTPNAHAFAQSHVLIEGISQNLPSFPFGYLRAIHSFIAATSHLFDGGMPGAIDKALALYLVPVLLSLPAVPAEITELLKGFPFSEKLLKSKMSHL